jgi:hypothetical protein
MNKSRVTHHDRDVCVTVVTERIHHRAFNLCIGAPNARLNSSAKRVSHVPSRLSLLCPPISDNDWVFAITPYRDGKMIVEHAKRRDGRGFWIYVQSSVSHRSVLWIPPKIDAL